MVSSKDVIGTNEEKRVEVFKIQELKNVAEQGGVKAIKNFSKEYRKLRVEKNRKSTLFPFHISLQSLTRQKYQSL